MIFHTDYLPTTIIEKNELFQLQREGTLEALCGGNIATESINGIVSARMAEAMEKHYGVSGEALDFYHEHMEVEEDHGARAVRILEKLAATDEAQKRGLLAMRRAITARRSAPRASTTRSSPKLCYPHSRIDGQAVPPTSCLDRDRNYVRLEA